MKKGLDWPIFTKTFVIFCLNLFPLSLDVQLLVKPLLLFILFTKLPKLLFSGPFFQLLQFKLPCPDHRLLKNTYNKVEIIMGAHHSTVDLSAPTILRP